MFEQGSKMQMLPWKIRDKRIDVMMLGLRTVAGGQGGVEAHVDHLARELDERGIRVEIVVRTPYAGRASRWRGTATHIAPIWSPRSASTEAIVHSALGVFYAAKHRPRIVHVHAVGPSLITPIARILGLKVVTTHHGEDYKREKWGRLGRAALRGGEWCAARFANARIVVSRSLAGQLSARFDKPFHYVPNGVALSKPVRTMAVLQTLGLEPGKYILHVGRQVPEKRQLDLCQALAMLKRPDIKLVLVGAADHESPYSRELTEYAEANPNVILAGFRKGTELAELFSHAGVFALPSSHEGLPIALLEAMAYGAPVVASNIQANLNVGLPKRQYVEVGNLSELAGAINTALDRSLKGDRPDWEPLLKEYSWPEIADRTIEIYREVTSGISGGPA